MTHPEETRLFGLSSKLGVGDTYEKEDNKKVWRLTEEDSHIVLALDKGLKSAGCYILNLIITVIIMKIPIYSLIIRL